MAISTKTRIFNMALHELGISAPVVNSEQQDDTRAVILNNYYEAAKDEVLKSYDWNFAEKYRVLTPSDEEILNPKYIYAYDYPNDCLNARDVYNRKNDILTKEFKVSATEKGTKIILCNIPAAVLRYTRRVDNETLFDTEFSTAVAMYLAGLTGNALTGSQQKADDALKKYWDKIRLAHITNVSEGQEIDDDDTTYLDAR